MATIYDLYLKGYVGDWNFSPSIVDYVLDKRKDKKVCVLIDSLGGRVDSAISISTAFKRHGDVHCHYVGMNASAATIASMGAKRVTIDTHALFLVHKCMFTVFEWDMMNADELDQHIKSLQKTKADAATIDGVIAGLYASRCKKPKDELLALMKEGAWLTAQQALEWGFVDEITDNVEDEAPVLTAEIKQFIAEAGLPKPPVMPMGSRSLLEKFLQLFSQLNRSDAKQSPDTNSHTDMSDTNTQTPAAQAQQPQTPAVQAQQPQTPAAQSQQPAKDHVTGADLQARLDASEKKLADLETKYADALAKIADLEKQPGDDTNPVIDSTSKPKNGDDDGPSDNPVADAFELLKILG